MKKRIVVKIGSSSLTNENGGLSLEKLTDHTEAIVRLHELGHEIILVSSGAVSAGFSDLGYPTRPVTVAGKQAAAAVGQGLLIQAYTEVFKTFHIVAAQLLLTRNTFTDQQQYSNAYATLTELLKRDVIPIINENDSVSVDELTFGDNDMLSALVSGLIHADHLIILTDINGIYSDNPKENPHAKRYLELKQITSELIHQSNSSSGSKFGTGGMHSKLIAAQTAQSLGIHVFIGTGKGKEKLLQILNGEGDGTYIGEQQGQHLNKPKQWIAFHSPIHGKIQVDKGAEHALLSSGKSLLPAGILTYEGTFDKGDVVEIVNMDQTTIAKGQVNYSSDELLKIKGLNSQEAQKKTKLSHPEVIHRDRLVLAIKGGESHYGKHE